MIKKRYVDYITVLLAIYFSVEILFINQDTLDEVSDFLPIVVPNIFTTLPIQIISQCLIVIIILGISVLKRKGKFKKGLLGIFFIYRLVTGIIQIAYRTILDIDVIRMGNYLLWVVEAILYWGILNSKSLFYDKNNYLLLFKIFNIIISIETIIQSVIGVLPQVKYTNLWYKGCIRIPIGASNTLSAFILPVVAMILLSKNKKTLVDKCCIILGIIAIFLTKSRTGMVMSLTIIMICIYKFITSKSISKRMIGVFFSVCGMLVCSYVVFKHGNDILTVFSGYSSVVNSNSFFDKITSNRTAGFKWYFEQIINHLIIGNGPNYIESRAHMIFIDILYQNGIIGLMILLTILNKVLKCSKNTGQLREEKILIIMILINSLFEISIFTSFVLDIMFFVSFSCVENFDKKGIRIENYNEKKNISDLDVLLKNKIKCEVKI